MRARWTSVIAALAALAACGGGGTYLAGLLGF